MAWELHDTDAALPLKVASNMAPYSPVKLDGSNAEQVVLAATAADRPFGQVNASVARAERTAVLLEDNIVKMVAAGSLGANTPVIVGSSNGALLPASQSITASAHWEFGIALSAAAAGGVFSCLVKPRKIS